MTAAVPLRAVDAAPRVVGLDLSLTATGISNGWWCDTITSKGSTRDPLATVDARLSHITEQVCVYAAGADLVVIEGPSHNSKYGHAWDRAGLWWRVMHRLLGAGTPVAVASPAARMKYATGKGMASKDAVMLAVARRWPDAEIRNNNEADAVVLAAMGLDQLGVPLAQVPKSHRAALGSVAWPEVAR